ncbi:putative ribonuclease H-like domain-containing protein [Tanacetum coccineum]
MYYDYDAHVKGELLVMMKNSQSVNLLIFISNTLIELFNDFGFDCDRIPERLTMYLNLWSYKVVRYRYSNPMMQPEPEGSTLGYPLDSVEVLRIIKDRGEDYEKLIGGFVAFGGKINGKGKIRTGKLDFKVVYFVKELNFNLFSVSQMCDKKNSVLFTDTAYVFLSLDFKGITCLFAKATPDESNLCYKRLGHKGKQHRASCIENLIDLKVKVIRCDNGTEFKNRVMNQFCEMKERKNRTLIEAARTMLADSKLPTTFACKRYYSNSKAFKIFKNRTRIVEENLHVKFSEDTPNIEKSGPNWLFDIDALTNSMNYKPVVADLPFFYSSKDSHDAGFKPLGEEEKKDAKDPGNEDSEVPSTKEPKVNQEKDASVDRINTINIVSPTVNTAGIEDNAVDENIVYGCDDDPNMHELEEIVYLDDYEDVGTEADINNSGSYGLHQAPELDYETLSKLFVLTMFQRGKIDKTLFIRRDKGDILLVQVYVDVIIFGSTKKSLCTEFKKMMHKKFQMSSMGEHTFFLGLQTTSTPIETQKPLLKDEDGEEVDVHLYRSMIGSLMYLTSSRPNIKFPVCACARYQVNPKVSHLHAVKRIFRYLKGQPKLGLWYPKDSPFDLVAYTDSNYAGASLDRKSTI